MTSLASIPWIESIPLWIFLALGIALIGIDIIFTNDNHAMWIGVAVIGAGVAGAFQVGGELQLVVFVVLLFVCIVNVRRWIANLPRKAPQSSSVIDLDDKIGTVLTVSDSMPTEGRMTIREFGEWQVKWNRAEGRLVPGSEVRVVGREGLVLLVEPAR